MKLKSKMYRSADYDSKWLSAAMDRPIAQGLCGYVLMGDKLVPYSLIDRFVYRFMGIGFGYGDVLSVRDVCGEELWNSLREDEREVAGDILLMLIEVGRFDIALPDWLEEGPKQDYSVLPYRDDMVYDEPETFIYDHKPEQEEKRKRKQKQKQEHVPESVAVGSQIS